MNDLLYDQFENNGLGENSKILEMFKKKNKKVRAIFLDNEDDQEILGVSFKTKVSELKFNVFKLQGTTIPWTAP